MVDMNVLTRLSWRDNTDYNSYDFCWICLFGNRAVGEVRSDVVGEKDDHTGSWSGYARGRPLDGWESPLKIVGLGMGLERAKRTVEKAVMRNMSGLSGGRHEGK